MQHMQPTTPQLNLDLGMDQDMSAPEMGGQDMGLPNGEIDHEGAMAKADLYKLANYSFKLFKKIDDTDQLEAWVQAKITKAADYIASVYHYLEYEMEFSEYGRKIENSEMYNESQKHELKTRLLEAKEKIKELKKQQADKISGKTVEEHFAYDEPKKGGKGNPSKDKLAVRGGLSSPTGDPDGYKDMVKGTGSFGRKAKDMYGINGPKGKLPESAAEKCNHSDKGKKCPVHGLKECGMYEAAKQTMSRAAKGHEKYGKEGMAALAKAGKEGKSLKPVRDKFDKYDEATEPKDLPKRGEKMGREGNAFGKAVRDAKASGDKTMSVGGKTMPVKEAASDKKKCPPMSHIKKMCQDGKSVAEICKMHPNCDRTELKQMVADCKKKLGEGSLPMKKVNGKSVPAFAADGKGKNDLSKKKSVKEGSKKTAAAAMWNNAKKKVTEAEGMGKIVRGMWVADPKGTVPAPSADQQSGSGITTPPKSDRNNTMTFPKAPQPQKTPQPAKTVPKLEESADLARIRVLSKRLNG